LGGQPYVSREAFLNYLMEDHGCGKVTANNKVRPGSTNMPIGALVVAEIIAPKDKGWVVSNNVLASTMMLVRASR